MAKASKKGVFEFDQFRLDADKLMLYRNGEEVSIPPKVAKTLVVLVERAGSILSKDELIERVWDDSIVEESNLTQYLYLLRKILGHMPGGRPYIETLRRRGYRFNAEVLQIDETPARVLRVVSADNEPIHAYSGVERDGNVLRVVDWQPVEASPSAKTDHSTPAQDVVHPKSLWPRFAIAAAVLAVFTGTAAITFFPSFMPVASNAESRRELSVIRLTNGSMPGGATISPDGNYFVYHESDGEIVRIYIQQTGQTSRMEIASSSDKIYHSTTFSPDGKFIYSIASDKGNGTTSLLRVPTLGDPSTKLLDNIGGSLSFSPDGKEMVFRRVNSANNETSYVIADKDGKAERVLLQRQAPKALSASPAWSPDGKLIAFAEYDLYDGKSRGKYRFCAANVSTAQVFRVSAENWDTVLRTAWLPDGKGFVTIATREDESYSTRRDQVYFISYPEGVSQRITTDGNRHEPDSLGVTKKGSILAVPGNRSSQIWSMNSNGDAATAVQITQGAADGRSGLGPLPDGRIAYLARTADEINILVSGADGSNPKQLASGFPFVEELRSDPKGKFLIFSSSQNQKNRLFRIEADGGEPKQLTFGEGNEIDSTISPDSSTIVYQSVVFQNNVAQTNLFKMPSGGGEATKLAIADCAVPNFSPDGSLLSCVRGEKEIVVVSAADGAELERYPLPMFSTWNFGIGWTPDGSGLIYIVTEKSCSNLWVQPRDGTKPHRLTTFSSGIIFRYAYSPDNSRFFVARGYPIQDVVLIENFR
ncbi:MAG: winged helix-turn-helix domain-containing protein [Acidobacteriota bacterium]